MVATPHCNQLDDKPPSWIVLLVRSVSGCLFASSYNTCMFREVTGILGPGWLDMVLFLRSDSSYNTWRDKVPQGPGWCDKVLFLRSDSSCNTWRDKVPQRQGWCDKILFVRSDSSFNTWRDVTRFNKDQGNMARSCFWEVIPVTIRDVTWEGSTRNRVTWQGLVLTSDSSYKWFQLPEPIYTRGCREALWE